MDNIIRPGYFYTTRRWLDSVSVIAPLIYTTALIIKYSSFTYPYLSHLVFIPLLWFGLRAIHAVTLDTALKSRIKYMRADENQVKVILIFQVLFLLSILIYKGDLFWLTPLVLTPFAIILIFVTIFSLALVITFTYPFLLIIMKTLWGIKRAR